MSVSELDKLLLDTYEEPQEEAEREQFSVRDEDMANWAVRKIAAARANFAEAERLAATERERIDTYLSSKRKDLERTEEFFSGLLTRYYLPQHEANPKQKTFKLPAGQVQFRAQQPDYERDDERLVSWLEANDKMDFVQIKKSARWGELKKALTQHGERMIDPESGQIVDGILVVPKGLKVSIVTASNQPEEV